MKMSKSHKKINATIVAALAATAVVPAAVPAAVAAEQVEVGLSSVVIENNGKLLKLDALQYAIAFATGAIDKNQNLQYVVDTKGNVFKAAEYAVAFATGSKDPAQTLQQLATDNKQVSGLTITDGKVENGGIVDQTPSTPEVESVETIDATFYFGVDEKPALPDTVDALVTYVDGTTKVESVPVSWNEEDIKGISTEEEGNFGTIRGTVTFGEEKQDVEYEFEVVADEKEAKKLEALQKMQQIVDNDLMTVDTMASEANDAASNASDEASYLSEESTAAEKDAVQKLVDEANKLIAKVENDIKEVKAAFDAAKAEAVKYGATADDFLTDEELDTSSVEAYIAEAKGYIADAELYLKGETPAPELTVSSVSANTEKGITTVTAKVTNATTDATATVEIVGAKDVKPQTVKVAADGTVTASFEGLAVGKYTAKVTVGEASASKEFTVEAAPVAELKVESVSAINLREVTVTFSGLVDKKTAETAGNYTADRGITFSSAKLNADGKSVTLFASSNLSTTDETALKVKDVKDTSGKVVAEYNGKVKGSDTSIPVVESVKALGPTTLEVTFSEPVTNAGLNDTDERIYTLDTTQLTTADAALSYVDGSNQRVVRIELTNALTAGEHTLKVNDGNGYTNGNESVQDFAGYQLQPTSVKFEVKQDLTLPAVEKAEFVDQQHVLVKFNKPVTLTEGADASANFYWNTTGTQGYTQYAADAFNTVEKVDETTYKVKFTGANYLREGKAYFFVTGIRDFNGNPIQVSKTELTVTKLGALEIASVESPSDNQIKIKFNRLVDNTTASSTSNYVVKNSEGKEQTLTSAVRGGTDNNEVTLTTTSTLPGGTYTVEVKNVKDTVGNTLATVTKEVTVNDTTPISSITATFVDSLNGKDKVVVSFPEAMTTTGTNGIGTAARYEIRKKASDFTDPSDANLWEALPSNAVVTVVDNKTVEISLPDATYTNGDYAQVRVNLVADHSTNLAPNKVASASTQITATTGIDISGVAAKILGTNKIEFKVGRHLSAISATDFLINPSGDPAFVPAKAEFKNNDDGTSTITLTSGEDLKVATHTYTVSTNPTSVTNTRDILGVNLASGKTTATAVNYAVPTVSTFSLSDATDAKVRVEFSKDMALVAASDFRVVVGDKTYTPSTATKVSGKVYDLTIPAVDIDASATVTTVAAPQSEDGVGNKLTAITEAKTVGNYKVAGVTFDKGTNASTLGDEKIAITFASAIKPQSIVAGWDGTSAIEVATVAVSESADTITLPGVGTVKLTNVIGDVIKADETLTKATYALDGNNKLVVTLTGLSNTQINLGATATSVLTLDATVQNADGIYINQDVTAQTATNLTDVATTISIVPNDSPNETFTLTNNAGIAQITDGTGDFKADSTTTLSPVTIGDYTFTVSRPATATTLDSADVLKITASSGTLTIAATDANATLNGAWTITAKHNPSGATTTGTITLTSATPVVTVTN